uniref:NADH-ubiquinone oxidoreductase chain 2 n=1 Tax=Oncopsis nigrofasciata TaxID=2689619 RepID=A0A6B9ISP2_9HEMI|nr:NADH dehydrogenase subunit 2 [Oncopsis nigrofasciata]
MYLNLSKILFFNIMTIGVMISASSNNWINMWTGMEIGVLSIVPLMTQDKISSDSSIKYFIVQSISSSMMIMSLMSMNSEINFKMVMLMSMLVKIGSSPFHVWVLSIIEGLSYYTMFMLFTLVKIPGMISLSMLNEQVHMWSIMSMIIGSIMAINQSSIKKLLSYSSIYNLGLMMSSINENQIWLNYMFVYSISLFMLIFMLSSLKVIYLNQMILNEIESMTKITIWILMMSMAGLPPLMGFSMKMMVLEKMIMKKEILMSMIVMLSSIIIIFLYMRISFTAMMMKSTLNKWMTAKTSNISFKILILNFSFTPMVLTMKSLV